MTARIDALLLAVDSWLTAHHHPLMWVRHIEDTIHMHGRTS